MGDVQGSVREFQFKPAPLRGSQRFRIDGDVVARVDDRGGVQSAVDLSQVSTAHYVEALAGRMIVRSLTLVEAGGAKLDLVHNGRPAHARNPDGVAYMGAIEAIATRLAETRPDFEIVSGPNRLGQWLQFLMFVGFAGFLLFLMLSSRLMSDAGPVGLLFVGLFAVSAFLAWRSNPWAPQPTISPAELAAAARRGGRLL